MTKEEFKVIFSTKLVEAYPTIEVNKFTTKLYWDHFKETPVEKFAEAVHRAVSELSFFPKIGELNKYLDAISGILSFDEAYLLIDEILDKSYSGSWKSSDYPEIVRDIISKSGGVSSIRQMTAEAKHITIKKRHKEIVQDLRRHDNGIKQLR